MKSKNTFKGHVDLSLIGEEDKRRYVLIKDFSTFMYDHTVNRGRKHFCRYFLQCFSTKEILIFHVNDCFKINDKQKIKILKKCQYVRVKNYARKIKSPFMIYADFVKALLSEDTGKQNPDEYYTDSVYSFCLQFYQ